MMAQDAEGPLPIVRLPIEAALPPLSLVLGCEAALSEHYPDMAGDFELFAPVDAALSPAGPE